MLYLDALDRGARPLEGAAAGLLEPDDARVVAGWQAVGVADHLAQPSVDAGRPRDGERPLARLGGAIHRVEEQQVHPADVVAVLVRQQHEVERLGRHVELEQVRQRLRRAVEQHAPVEEEPTPVAAEARRRSPSPGSRGATARRSRQLGLLRRRDTEELARAIKRVRRVEVDAHDRLVVHRHAVVAGGGRGWRAGRGWHR